MREAKNNGFNCPRCGVGRCLPGTTTFVDVFAGHILSVPNIPVYVCDVCHFAEFEQTAIESLWDEIAIDDYGDDFQSSTGRERSSPFDG